jgi:hypothetical protein
VTDINFYVSKVRLQFVISGYTLKQGILTDVQIFHFAESNQGITNQSGAEIHV